MRPGLAVHTDLRDRLGKNRGDLAEFEAVVREMQIRMKRDEEAAEGQSIESLTKIDEATGLRTLPHWLAQPYFRPIQVRPQPPAPAPAQKQAVVSVDATSVQLSTKRLHSERTPEPTVPLDEEPLKRARLVTV